MEAQVQPDGESQCYNRQEQSFASSKKVVIVVWLKGPTACVLASTGLRRRGVVE